MLKNIVLSLFGIYLSACSYPLSLVTDPGAASQGNSSFNAALVNIDPQLKASALGILQQNCTSCHLANSGPANVYGLTDINHLFSSGLMIAGNPDGSPLFQSIKLGTMPQKGPLSQADQDIIRNFIIAMGVVASTDPTYQPPEPVTPEPTFSYLQKYVLGPNCAGCHYAGHAKGGYAFDTYQATLKAVNKLKPSESKLYQTTRSGEMPPSPRPAFSSETTSLILTWIQNGALNN